MKIVILIGLAVWLGYEFITSKPIPTEYLNCNIGGLGAGKTFLAVRGVIQRYHKKLWSYYWSIWRHPLRKEKQKVKPTVYSNIPLILDRFTMAKVLKKEHIFMEELLPQNSDVLFDEIGQACDQFKYDIPAVKHNVQTFVRFLRQFVGGMLFSTEQSSDFIAKPIRARFSKIVEVKHFHRVLGFLPFCKVYWRAYSVTNDVVNISDVKDNKYNKFFFFCWYGKHYHSKPYAPAYKEGFTHEAPEKWDRKNLQTRYIIDVTQPCVRDLYQSSDVKVKPKGKK